MWFARLFGGRRADDDDQPTATPPVPRKEAPPRASNRPAVASVKREPNDKKGKGFDPYNTGSFQRNAAWDRVNR